MIHIFNLAWNPETGETNFSGSVPLAVIQQLVTQIMVQQAVKEAKEEPEKKAENEEDKD